MHRPRASTHLHRLTLLGHLLGELEHLRLLFVLARLDLALGLTPLRILGDLLTLLGFFLLQLGRPQPLRLLVLLHHDALVLLLAPLDHEPPLQDLLMLLGHARLDRAVQLSPELGLAPLDVGGVQPLRHRLQRGSKGGQRVAHLRRDRRRRLLGALAQLRRAETGARSQVRGRSTKGGGATKGWPRARANADAAE